MNEQQLRDLLREAADFWGHYSSLNEGAQDDMAQEKSDMLDRMRNALAQPAAPTSQVERWNIERDGDALLICFNDHEKGAGCRYQRFVPERPTAPSDVERDAARYRWLRTWVKRDVDTQTVVPMTGTFQATALSLDELDAAIDAAMLAAAPEGKP